ncbi:AsmA family protein [Alsobacter sp. R-9]
MKRHWILGATLAVAGIAAASVPWPVPASVLEGQIAPQLAAAARVPVGTASSARFTLLPVPRLDIERPALRDDAGGVTVEASRLRGRLRLLPLVGGRMELTEIMIFGPRLTLRADGASETTLRRMADIVHQPGHAPGAPPFVERLVVIDGSVETVEATGARATIASRIDTITERGPEPGTFDVSGTMTWRGETVSFQSFSVDFAALLSARPATVSVRMGGDLGSVDFTGKVLAAEGLQAEGRLALKTSAVKRLAQWADLQMPVAFEGGADLQGQFRLRDGDASLTDATITVRQGRLEGALHLKDTGGRPSLSGTLAGERLDLTADAIRLVGALRGDDGGWSRDIIDPAILPAGDMDVRVSATRAAVGSTTLANVAFSVLSRQGKTDITLGGAELGKGSAKARLSLATAPRGFDVKAQATFERVDMATILSPLVDGRRLTGAGFGLLQVEGSGSSVHAVMRSLEGKSSLLVRQGDIGGINLPEVLRRIEKRPLVAALDVRGGRTPFDVASFMARISKGVAEIVDGTVGSPAARVSLSGHIALADRHLSMSGLAQLLDAGAGREPVTLPFEVTGSFDDPMLVPDARALLRRSGATAPLFDARTRGENGMLPAGAGALAPAPQ